MSDAELSFPARDFPAYSNTFNRKFVRLNQITMIQISSLIIFNN